MSLEQPIDRLQNRLISAFAVFDSWCDHYSDAQGHDQKAVSNFHQLLQEIITLNAHVLKHTFYSDDDNASQDGLRYENVPESLRLEISLEINHGGAEFVRRQLRDQLYDFLCLLDHPVADHFYAPESSSKVEGLDGYGIIELVNNYLYQYIKDYSAVPAR
jgi:hypothetical protein